jgi:hypothetical protein
MKQPEEPAEAAMAIHEDRTPEVEVNRLHMSVTYRLNE